MQPIYSFDPERFYLGTLCKRGHRWPGTDLSLRRIYKDKQGRTVNPCLGCKGRKDGDWLISFIDIVAMGLTDGDKLGPLCKSGHKWNGHDLTLRDKHGKCRECERDRNTRRRSTECHQAYQAKRYQDNKERLQAEARNRMRKLLADPEYRQKHSRRVAERRKSKGRESRAKGLGSLVLPYGVSLTQVEARAARELIGEGHPINWDALEPLVIQRVELILLVEKNLQSVGKFPSVAKLVFDEQKRYWEENPEAKKAHDRWWAKERWRLSYQTNPELRLYHREKSKRRKARLRDSMSVQVKPRQIRERFRLFDNCCAYCGGGGDMQIEHVVPIAQGGTHALGNIVPACQRCNMSKTDHNPETWYRQQSFFSELRWKKICKVLEWSKSSVGQLALL